jgi:pimeloyl-ACP methyl ester carboxylesterase
MTTALSSSAIELEYDTFGFPDDPALLPGVTVPMLVIDGLDDVLTDPSGGHRTAELGPGAHLLEVADMGHDMSAPLCPSIVGAIFAHGEVDAANATVAVPS